MSMRRRTYREVDGERIEGTWHPVFVRNGDTHYLSDLLIYADGLIDCWGPVDLEGFRQKVRSGWVATTLPANARASSPDIGAWRFGEPESWMDAEGLVAEVADTIDCLAGRPDSSDRCLVAVQALREHPGEEHREALRVAYAAVPEHRRDMLCGMDWRDQPVRVLMTNVGEVLDGDVVTENDHAEALAYFAEQENDHEEADQNRQAEVAEAGTGPTTTLEQIIHTRGWPDPPGLEALRTEYPRPIEYAGRRYRSVDDAFWILSTDDAGHQDQIAKTENPYRVRDVGLAGPRRPGWSAAQIAVMTDLLRAKFAQHDDLAVLLTGTGDGRIMYHLPQSPFWGTCGRNWLGRLLELVRAEHAAAGLD